MAGYSGNPLDAKLGIAAGSTLIVVDGPPAWVGSVLRLPPGVRVGDLRLRTADVILAFCRSRDGLERRRAALLDRLPADGTLWVAWPKRSSAVVSDLTEGVLREVLLPYGVVDVKVAALDDTWSGLRFVVRTVNRPSWHGSA